MANYYDQERFTRRLDYIDRCLHWGTMGCPEDRAKSQPYKGNRRKTPLWARLLHYAYCTMGLLCVVVALVVAVLVVLVIADTVVVEAGLNWMGLE